VKAVSVFAGVFAAIAFLAAMPALAADKTLVRVAFMLDDPHYTDEFTDADLSNLKRDAAEAIAGALRERFRFLDFAAQDDPASEYSLSVELGRAEGGGADVAEFGFHFSLTGPEVPDDVGSYLIFRDKEHYRDAIGEREALVEEIRARIEQISRDGLISDLLRYVSIAEVGEFRGGEPPIWLIDRDRSSLCITRKAFLEVLTILPVANLGQVRESIPARVMELVTTDDSNDNGARLRLRSRIIATPADESDVVDRLRAANATDVRIERVFVVAYDPICPPRPIPASQVDFSGDGDE
jgi:hypothetical protein